MAKTSLIGNLIWKFAERIVAQLVTFVVSIILARCLNPEDYGVVAIVTVFITIANVFVSDGLGSALIQKKDSDILDFSSVFYANILFSFLLYALLFFCAPLVSSLYEMPILTPVMRALGLRIPLAAINSIQQAYVSRKMIFRKFFLATFVGTVLSAIVGIYMAMNGFGVWALVAQYLINSLVGTIVLWITVKWRPAFVFSLERLKVLLQYGSKILAVGLLTSIYNEIRSLIIGKKYTSADLAFYNRGHQLPHLFVTNINASIIGVLFPVVSKVQDDKATLKRYTKLSIKISNYLMAPLMLGLFVVSDNLIPLLLTEKWNACIPFLKVFCISYLLLPMQTANIQAIKAMGRAGTYLKIEVTKKIVGMALLLISIPFGPLAIAYSAALASVSSSVINSYPNRKLLDYSYFEQIGDILPNIVIAGIMAVVVWVVGAINCNLFAKLFIQICVGSLTYLLLSIITRNTCFKYLIGILRGKIKKRQ